MDAYDAIATAPARVRLPLVGDWDGERVKALREHLNLTQVQFSEKLGSRQQTVSEWECGKYKPRGMSRTMLDRIAQESDFEG